MWQAFSYYATLAVEAALGVFGIRLYEEPRHEAIERIGDRVYIRSYGPRLAAQAVVATPGDAGRSEAFQLLFNYIAGANAGAGGAADRIAMTTPVEVRPHRIAMTTPVQATETTGAVQMQFFLPATYTLQTAPAPSDPRVNIVTVPAETIAALRFSGTGRDFAERQADLLQLLKTSAWQPVGDAYALNYDAPFTLPFLRRNEAAVAVRKPVQ
jgi:hypothetical protein